MPPATKLILLSLLLALLLNGRGSLSMGMEAMEMEMEMDSETHRWLVPCFRLGVPYYNCRITTTANRYIRGCESITRCRETTDP
jgi:hypothetical protein